MAPALPCNIKRGQLRKRLSIVSQETWNELSEEQRDAVDALSLQLYLRGLEKQYPAFEGRDCIFLTVRRMQGLLRAIGARRKGEKTAAAAISLLEQRALIVDTGKTKKPRRTAESIARAEKFQKRGTIAHEGGKGSAGVPAPFLLVASLSCSGAHQGQRRLQAPRGVWAL
jgi:hypothetical protein